MVTPTTPHWRQKRKRPIQMNMPAMTITAMTTDMGSMRTVTVITTMPVINTTIVPTTNRY